jgi:hypothetical protein
MQDRHRQSPIRRWACLGLLLAAGAIFLPACGCSGALAGDWYLSKAIPSKDVFAIDDVHFDHDGRFTATVTIEGKTAREKGSYEFNGFKLTLRPQAGGQRRYHAVLKATSFEVLDGDRKVILRKGRKSKQDAQYEERAEENKP